MVIELRVVQFWSEIILVISNRTRAHFEIKRMISDQIALHSVQLPLFIAFDAAVSLRNAPPICGNELCDQKNGCEEAYLF